MTERDAILAAKRFIKLRRLYVGEQTSVFFVDSGMAERVPEYRSRIGCWGVRFKSCGFDGNGDDLFWINGETGRVLIAGESVLSRLHRRVRGFFRSD